MNLVGTAFEGEAYDGLAGVSELGGQLRSLELELAHCLDGRGALVEVADLSHLAGGQAVDPELVLKGAAAVDADLV